jgi:hypothetical protein
MVMNLRRYLFVVNLVKLLKTKYGKNKAILSGMVTSSNFYSGQRKMTSLISLNLRELAAISTFSLINPKMWVGQVIM